jgi:AraC-like DNA-binding protein
MPADALRTIKKTDGSPIAMKLDYAPPPADLAEYISAFYLFDAHVDELHDIERADIAQFRVILSGEGRVIFPDGREAIWPTQSVFGPRLGASKIVAKGPHLRLFGFGMLPAGWAMAVQKPADKYVNQVIPAKDVMSFDMDYMTAQIAARDTLQDMMDYVVEGARRLYSFADNAPFWFIRAVDAWLEADLVPEIDMLEASTGLSRRQIERLAKQFYGAPPKFLIRKYRALRAANAIANGNSDWQDFIDTAYYDQSHFIRDIKEFTGMTPSAIRNATSPLSILSFGRSRLAGDVRPLVSRT